MTRFVGNTELAGDPELVEERVVVGGTELVLLRPADPEALIDEREFARDEFMPYWAELWPAARALAATLPERLDGLRVVELGAGLGLPALVAAARGAEVTATDWAAPARALLRENAARNGVELRAEQRDWREPWDACFDLALAADVLYEARNVEPLLALLPGLAPEVLLAEPGRPYAVDFFARARAQWRIQSVGAHVLRLRLGSD